MPKKQETASGRLPSLPEGVVTLQEDTGIPGKINLSVEEEIRQLRERNRQLEAENALLRERETARARDGIETFNEVIKTLRQLQPGKETNRFFVEAKRKIEATSPEDRPLIVNSRIKAAVAMIRNSPPLVSVSMGGGQYHYNTRTRTENRALALVDYLKHTGKGTIKMPEARAVLEDREGKHLDRKVIWRAMRATQGLLRASKDIAFGVTRLVFDPLIPPDLQVHGTVIDEGEESRVNAPRPQRNRVPWNGAD
jgi:hypothetical protein